ncbi:MAG: YbbR-like domain-containing protein [Prevotella sp.]|nr:YbbR-like domain-containing protein [Prevotella sp.]
MGRLSDTLHLVRNFFFNLVNKEFLIFLFFLLLSGAFWLITTMNETYEKEIPIPLRLEGMPKNVVVTSDTEDTLRVTVRDRGYVLASYLYGGNIMPLRLNFNTYNKGNGRGSASTSDLQKLIYQRIFKSSRITSIKPDKFEYTYNNGESKLVSVSLAGKILPGKSYYLSKIKFTPEFVTIYAEKNKLDSIKTMFTEKLNIANVTDTLEQTVNLTKIRGVKALPSTVKMSIYPDVLTEESIEVPITAVNMPEGKVLRTFPSRVKVLFTTGASMYRGIHAEQFRVEADYNEIQDHPSEKCSIRVVMAPSSLRNIRTEPEQVDYLIEAQ